MATTKRQEIALTRCSYARSRIRRLTCVRRPSKSPRVRGRCALALRRRRTCSAVQHASTTSCFACTAARRPRAARRLARVRRRAAGRHPGLRRAAAAARAGRDAGRRAAGGSLPRANQFDDETRFDRTRISLPGRPRLCARRDARAEDRAQAGDPRRPGAQRARADGAAAASAASARCSQTPCGRASSAATPPSTTAARSTRSALRAGTSPDEERTRRLLEQPLEPT